MWAALSPPLWNAFLSPLLPGSILPAPYLRGRGLGTQKPPCTAALQVTTGHHCPAPKVLLAEPGPTGPFLHTRGCACLPNDPGRCHPEQTRPAHPPEPEPPPRASSTSCHQDLDSPVMTICPTTSCLTRLSVDTSPQEGDESGAKGPGPTEH